MYELGSALCVFVDEEFTQRKVLVSNCAETHGYFYLLRTKRSATGCWVGLQRFGVSDTMFHTGP